MKIDSSEQMELLGQQIGRRLRGGEIIELVGDVGTGKTTLTRGIARGLAIDEPITSPSFTISCHYCGRDGLSLNHYDFYRLNTPGIIANELVESLNDPHGITIIEWGESVNDILPPEHITIAIEYRPDQGRNVDIAASGDFNYLAG